MQNNGKQCFNKEVVLPQSRKLESGYLNRSIALFQRLSSELNRNDLIN